MILAGRVDWLLSNVKQNVRGCVPIIVLIVFTLIGAILFKTIEGPHEEEELRNLKAKREKLLEDTAFRLNSIKSMTPVDAYNHTVRTLVDYRNNLGVHEVHLNETKWTIWGAIYYSMTIYTTIGYGNIVPHTTVGRALTILYAFIGIPLALFSLVALGSLFAKACLMIWKFIVRTCGCFSKNLERKMTRLGPNYNAGKEEQETESEENADELLNFPVAFLVLLTICWIFICAYIFQFVEETWSYGTSLYFVLISFTTIGFGDVLVSKSKYILLVGSLLLIGLALVSTVLTIIQKQIHAVGSTVKDSIDKEYMAALEQANEEMGEDGKENGGYKDEDDVEDRKHPPLDHVIKRMPLKSRVLYHIMPAANRKQLAKHAKKRAQFGVKAVQTDPWIMQGGGNVIDNINY